MKKCMSLILALALLLSLAACAGEEAPQTTAAGAEVSFTVVVTDLEGNSETFDYSTAMTDSLGEFLLEEGLVEGEDGEYGLFITAVNGVAADWDKDQTYWAFYIDGEYATTGVDATAIAEGAEYSFVLTKG